MTDAEKQNYDALFINIFERLEKLERQEDGTVVKTVSKKSLDY
ncbi:MULTISPECIES: hypothetical protein [Streptococcus]|nr:MULTISPECIES: hypothetical protein [Streptococcus]